MTTKATYEPETECSSSAQLENSIQNLWLQNQYQHNAHEPPTYGTDDTSLQGSVKQLVEAAQANDSPVPISSFPRADSYQFDSQPVEGVDATRRLRQEIVTTYFDALKTKKDEVVAAMIEGGLVKPETTDEQGRTPLLAAIDAGNLKTVQELVDFEANVNLYGNIKEMPRYTARVAKQYEKAEKTMRTPLQYAAQKGNLAIVKLLMETYHADDSLIAPDGELALRLAATNGHKEIVEYLPSRRGGGWKRWKVKHSKAMRRAKKAGHRIYKFFYYLLYGIPKCLVYDLPMEIFGKKLVKGVKWMIKHPKEIPAAFLNGVKKTVKQVGKFLKNFAKFVWHLIQGVPELVKETAKWIARAIKNTPKALKIATLWVWGGIESVGRAIGRIFGRFFSFLHTALAAIASFFQNLTLKDVWDGFVTFLHAVFVDGPMKVFSWIRKFGEVTYKIMKTLFGCLGEVAWWVVRGLIELMIYIPKQLWRILESCGSSVGGGIKEVLIWCDPKRG